MENEKIKAANEYPPCVFCGRYLKSLSDDGMNVEIAGCPQPCFVFEEILNG